MNKYLKTKLKNRKSEVQFLSQEQKKNLNNYNHHDLENQPRKDHKTFMPYSEELKKLNVKNHIPFN